MHVRKIEIFLLEFEISGFNFRKIKNVIYYSQQCVAARADCICV